MRCSPGTKPGIASRESTTNIDQVPAGPVAVLHSDDDFKNDEGKQGLDESQHHAKRSRGRGGWALQTTAIRHPDRSD